MCHPKDLLQRFPLRVEPTLSWPWVAPTPRRAPSHHAPHPTHLRTRCPVMPRPGSSGTGGQELLLPSTAKLPFPRGGKDFPLAGTQPGWTPSMSPRRPLHSAVSGSFRSHFCPWGGGYSKRGGRWPVLFPQLSSCEGNRLSPGMSTDGHSPAKPLRARDLL